MNVSPIEILADVERVFVHAATVSMLSRFLVADAPWIWILGHRPQRTTQWWKTSVALNVTGNKYEGLVRELAYDLQLPTADFVARAAEFDDHGLALIQSRQLMPETLFLENVSDVAIHKVLRLNGAVLRIWLPHAVETAMIECFIPGHLGRVLGQEPPSCNNDKPDTKAI